MYERFDPAEYLIEVGDNMVVHEKLFDDKEYLRCEILEVLSKSYRVKLVDYGVTIKVEKVFPQDKEKHTGPNWVSQFTSHIFNFMCYFGSPKA